MTLTQIGILTEIGGFLILAVLAGVLLERGVLGIWAGKAESFFSSLVANIDKYIFPKWILELVLGHGFTQDYEKKLSSTRLSKFASNMLISALIGLAVSTFSLGGIISIVIGILHATPWLLWCGVSLIGLIFITFAVISGLSSWLAWRHELGWEVVLLAIGFSFMYSILFLVYAAIASPLYLVLCVFALITRLLQQIGLFLARENMLRRVSIIAGTMVVLAGLVLQFIDTL